MGFLSRTLYFLSILFFESKIIILGSLPYPWEVSDGSSVSTSTYSALHSAIGYTWGGSGSSFNIPDLKNAHLRGVGASTVFTQNNTTTLGQTINDQFQGHGHKQRIFTGTANYASKNGDNYSFIAYYNILEPTTIGTYGTVRFGNETRVNARGVQFIIKF